MTLEVDPAAVSPRAPLVSVIVPHYRDLSGLDRCLSALSDQTFPRQDYEVVVADNNSPEGEHAVAEVIAGRARLVIVREPGAGPARNGGAAAAVGALFAFTDADCVPEPRWLAAGVRALDDFDVVGGRMTVLVNDERRMTPAECYERVFAFDNAAYVRRERFTVSANLFCSRQVFERVGLFRTGVSEDIDWSWRAVDAGLSLGYAADAVVGHPARRTWSELERKTRRVNAELFALMLSRGGTARRWRLRCLAMPLSAIAHTPRVLASPQLRSSADRVAALATLYRLRFWRGLHGLGLPAPIGAPVGGDGATAADTPTVRRESSSSVAQ